MRSLLLIMLLVAAGGIVYVLTSATNDRTVPDTVREETKAATDTAPATTSNEGPGANADTVGAQTDIGMEFPVADMRTFNISGTNFVFDVTEIRVKKGDHVMINFTSADGFHDLVIDEFDVRTERLRTGGTQHVMFVADKAGTFEYYCSVGSHRVNGMVGKLIVE